MPPSVRQKAQLFLDELEANRLEVVLIPSGDPDIALHGGMIRVVQSQNAKWNREWCKEHGSNRKDIMRWSKHKTKIKRQHTRRALKELIAGKCETPYARELAVFIKRWKFERWQLRAVA